MNRTLPIVLILFTAFGAPIHAQQSNVEVLGSLAVKCMGGVPGSVNAFRLRSGSRMPYLRSFLTREWLSRGYTVFVGDSANGLGHPLHELSYDAESAKVTYARTRGDSLIRNVDLSLSHSFVSPQGMLLAEARCQDRATDVVQIDDVARLQQEPWEEVRGTIPVDHGLRTWVEPTVIGTSIAVVVYLFFSVRS